MRGRLHCSYCDAKVTSHLLVERLANVLARELDLDHARDLAEDGRVWNPFALLVLVDDLRLAPDFLDGRVEKEHTMCGQSNKGENRRELGHWHR